MRFQSRISSKIIKNLVTPSEASLSSSWNKKRLWSILVKMIIGRNRSLNKRQLWNLNSIIKFLRLRPPGRLRCSRFWTVIEFRYKRGKRRRRMASKRGKNYRSTLNGYNKRFQSTWPTYSLWTPRPRLSPKTRKVLCSAVSCRSSSLSLRIRSCRMLWVRLSRQLIIMRHSIQRKSPNSKPSLHRPRGRLFRLCRTCSTSTISWAVSTTSWKPS